MGYKILLADDSVTVQKIVTLTFSDEGVDVVPVNSGDEAAARLQYLRPALVMADVSLPGKNGYELCAFIKAHAELKHIPVILLVPAFEPFDEIRAVQVGADHHLTKPFQSIRTLIATVKELIEPGARKTEKPERSGSQPFATAAANPVAETPPTPVPSAGAETLPQTGELLDGLADVKETSAPERAEEWSEPTKRLPNVPPMPGEPARQTSFADDDILELDDVLPTVPMLYQPQPVVVPQPTVTSTITQAVKVTSVEAVTTTTIPQSVIDDIVNRVAAQVSAQLLEILPDRLTARLVQELTPRLTSQVAETVKQTLPAPKVDNYEGDLLLDLE